jgi:chromosome partitioning protein
MRKTIVAVTNQKGGVGKTTTSINLSSGLAQEGCKVLLIDLDPQANSTIGTGIEPGSYQGAMHDVMLKKKKITDIILPTPNSNLYVAPSHIHLDKAELLITPEMFKETFLHNAIKNVDYEFVIIDCRPTLGSLTINALYACNFILVPCEMGRYALDGFSDLMEIVLRVKGSKEVSNVPFRILLTKFESRNKVTNDWIRNQLSTYEKFIFKTIIRKNEALNQAHMMQQPIFNFRPDSAGANDYQKLTTEFLNLCHQSETV